VNVAREEEETLEEEPHSETELLDSEADSDADVQTLTEVEQLRLERDSYLSDLQRVQAEFVNFRRQAEKRQREMSEQAASGLVDRLLPVLDACEAAIQHGANDVTPIHSSLLETLQAVGLEIVGSSGDIFDPGRHEAVIHEPSEDIEVAIVEEVMRSGYVWKGRTIRPAMVRVKG
jgi:molecular chaperone GrpE